MFTGSEDGTIKIWDLRAPGYQRDYHSKGGAITSVVLHPNQGEIIAGGEDGSVRVWDLTASACYDVQVPDGKTPIRSVTIASDASLLMAGNNRGVVYVWKLGKGTTEPVSKIEAHNTYLLKCLLSPDVKLLATTSADKSIKIWNLDRGFQLERTLTGHQGWVWDCSFSADSAYIVSASSDKTARLWDVKTGDIIVEYKGHSKALTSIALNDSS